MSHKSIFLCVMMALCVPALAQTIDSAPPKTIWDTDLDGTGIHVQSGLQCPMAMGDYRRTRLVAFDKTGLDVACNYKDARTGDDITIYLTRRDPALLEKTFDSAKQAVVIDAPTAKARDTVLPAPHSDLKWLQAGFSEHDGHLASDLFLTNLVGWEYEIRATYQLNDAAGVTAMIADIDALLMKSAGAHLKACAAVPVPGRAGQPLRTPKMLTLALSGAFRVIAMKSDLEKGADWCVENSLTIDGQPYLDWRNIVPGADVVQRLTGVAGAPRAYTFKDPAIAQIATLTDPASVPADGGYVVAVDKTDVVVVMDIYAGYPPLMDVAKLLAGGHPTLVAVSKTDKKITVNSAIFKPQ